MIAVEHLTKCYGDFMAVKDLSFTIEDGHVYGFLGPNGAGKSTTMNIMTGTLSATEGHVTIDGHDIFEEPKAAKRLIGYLPEQPPLYMNESPIEYLTFVGQAKGLRGQELDLQITKAIEQTGIGAVQHKRIAALSKGYKQRVGIAQALLGNPRVIILDEPTVGLDPLQIIEIRALIKKLGEEHTVILSSHILSEVQTICDKILMIAKGKLVAFDTPDNLEKNLLGSGEINMVTDAAPQEIYEILEDISHIADVSVEKHSERAGEGEPLYTAHVRTDREDVYDISRAIFFAFANRKRALLEFSVKKANLEDVFIELSQEAEQEAAAAVKEKGGETVGTPSMNAAEAQPEDMVVEGRDGMPQAAGGQSQTARNACETADNAVTEQAESEVR